MVDSVQETILQEIEARITGITVHRNRRVDYVIDDLPAINVIEKGCTSAGRKFNRESKQLILDLEYFDTDSDLEISAKMQAMDAALYDLMITGSIGSAEDITWSATTYDGNKPGTDLIKITQRYVIDLEHNIGDSTT